MPNHVHALIEPNPCQPSGTIVSSRKRYSARMANRHLAPDRSGRTIIGTPTSAMNAVSIRL
ncbi:MAG: transposase [Proteobacteria bacterium]|nr:transposase [Pseudomonadota bacterium]